MQAEIIAVGTELLMGQIANTNAQFIAKHLNELAINHYQQTVVGDNPQRLVQATKAAEARGADLLIYSGGIGPTRDDLTKQTLADYLGLSYQVDPNHLAYLEEDFASRGRELTANNKNMALVIEGGQALTNPKGQALGALIEKGGRTYIMLPGPPSELKAMFMSQVFPYLQEKSGQADWLMSRYLNFFGLGESQIATSLDDLIAGQTNPTIAIYAANYLVTVRITANADDKDQALDLLDNLQAEILDRIGDNFVGLGENFDPASLVRDYLADQNLTIALAESLTGGLAAAKLVALPGISQYFQGSIVAYQAQAKHDLLNVDQAVLDQHGMVSSACARLMAENTRVAYQADIGLSFTGVAGPEEMEGQPVGKVFVGIARRGQESQVLDLQLYGNRQDIRTRAIYQAFITLTKEQNICS
ncbi:hypothetical protein AWM75_06690 [Aerococcus urinaehominis]|uniref:Putative competence-damage inducible protein n=1 Tax=Aerococcus urinaehominis TaxID=128944 RepID=A0A0X8FLZ9_9LACT|nr:competence/damage-inducible protein A [Aerococcus urinaehominis]AMB99687.1 hypothetical protein AWM75_06690 [Aerococcus urinaehominis]SDL90525.1 nicotinamide-nucleotide amidase [Aerococcus urinaehominis]